MGELTLSSAPEMDDEDDAFDSEISLKLQSVLGNYNIESEEPDVADEEEDINPDITELLRALISGNTEDNSRADEPSFENDEESEASMGTEEDELPPFDLDEEDSAVEELEEDSEPEVEREVEVDVEDTDDVALAEEIPEETIEETIEETVDEVAGEEKEIPTPVYRIIDDYVNSSEADEKIASLMEMNEELSLKLRETEAEKEKLLELVSSYEKRMEDARRERITLIENLDAAKRREERERDRLAEAAKLAVAERGDEDKPVYPDEPVSAPVTLPKPVIEEPVAPSEPEAPSAPEKAPEEPAPVRYVSKVADISFRHPVDPNITKRIQDIIVTTVKYFGKENVYMKIKASIPDNYMVRLEFVKIPENESELLNDIIRVLGHSKLGITKVLLD
jgi:hypothetical protein